jgi:hypothetical protein
MVERFLVAPELRAAERGREQALQVVGLERQRLAAALARFLVAPREVEPAADEGH